jgi:hypothetical protein
MQAAGRFPLRCRHCQRRFYMHLGSEAEREGNGRMNDPLSSAGTSTARGVLKP